MKIKIIPLIIALVLFFVGYKVIEYTGQVITQEELDFTKEMCTNGLPIVGKLQPEVKKVVTGRGGLRKRRTRRVKYQFTYNYLVNNETFSAIYTSKEKTAPQEKQFWYNKLQPAENIDTEPCIELDIMKSKTIGDRLIYLGVGVLILIIGVILFWISFKSLFKKKNA